MLDPDCQGSYKWGLRDMTLLCQHFLKCGTINDLRTMFQ